MTAPELKPCPFCGGTNAFTVEHPRAGLWGTMCKDCDVWRDDRRRTELEAIYEWNTRIGGVENRRKTSEIQPR